MGDTMGWHLFKILKRRRCFEEGALRCRKAMNNSRTFRPDWDSTYFLIELENSDIDPIELWKLQCYVNG